jgi:hypothetical protein
MWTLGDPANSESRLFLEPRQSAMPVHNRCTRIKESSMCIQRARRRRRSQLSHSRPVSARRPLALRWPFRSPFAALPALASSSHPAKPAAPPPSDSQNPPPNPPAPHRSSPHRDESAVPTPFPDRFASAAVLSSPRFTLPAAKDKIKFSLIAPILPAGPGPKPT